MYMHEDSRIPMHEQRIFRLRSRDREHSRGEHEGLLVAVPTKTRNSTLAGRSGRALANCAGGVIVAPYRTRNPK